MTQDALARREIVLLCGLLLADAAFYFIVIPNGIADPAGFGLDQGLPPSFTARVVAILMAVIMALRLVRLMLQPDLANSAEVDPADGGVAVETATGLRNLAGIFCGLVFALALVPLAGYYLAGVCMVAALMFVMEERRWPYLIVQPLAVIGLIWALFDQVFSIRLPSGLLFGG